jgi:hypothetical protein
MGSACITARGIPAWLLGDRALFRDGSPAHASLRLYDLHARTALRLFSPHSGDSNDEKLGTRCVKNGQLVVRFGHLEASVRPDQGLGGVERAIRRVGGQVQCGVGDRGRASRAGQPRPCRLLPL